MRMGLLTAGVAVLAAGLGGVMSAQPADGARAAQNKSIVEESLKAWAAGTGSPYDLLTESSTWTIVGRSAASRTYRGREAFMREVIQPFNARMSAPLKPVIRRIYADGDTVIAFFDAKGTASDGRPYANTYAWFLEMRDARIVAAHAFFDSVEFNDLWTRVAPAGAK